MKSPSARWLLGGEFRFAAFLLGGLVILFGVKLAGAQVTASVSGRVEDASGAAVPGTTVTVRNLETGTSRLVSSDDAGRYRALSLPVGHYEVKAEREGFKTAVRTGINLVVGQEAVVNLRLEVGEVVQEVTVTGEAPLVNTTTASVSGLVGEREVKDLPLNGRSFDNLITLNPGTLNYSKYKAGTTGPSSVGNYFSVAGRRPLDNLFLLNGIEYTSSTNMGLSPGGVSGQLLGIDAVREFNTATDTYSAQYGKRAGAQVSIVTQSGTNQFHGAAFEFIRNSALDARNFFDYPRDLRIPPFQRNQFGGAAGGPIQKDKVFLFGNYEGFRERLGTSFVSIVPDEQAWQGLLPNAAGQPIPVPNLDPRMLRYKEFWPLPNGPNLGDGTALAFYNPKQTIREDFGTVRADYNVSDRDSLSGVYTVDDGVITTPQGNPLWAVGVSQRLQVVSLQETHIFSPTVLNTFRAGFSRAGYFFGSSPLAPVPANLAFFQGSAHGKFTIGGGIATAGSQNTTRVLHQRNLFSYTDDIQISKGIHQITLGGWFQRVQTNDDAANSQGGGATFNTLATFLQGNAFSFIGVLNPTGLGWRTWLGAWYLEDSVQLRPRLTVRLGVRHEFANLWNEVAGRASTFVFDSNGIVVTSPRVSKSPLTENNATRLFSPRVGLAWDPFGNGKTAIRTGFGIYHTLNDNLGAGLNSVAPYNDRIQFDNVSLPSLVPMIPGASGGGRPACGPGVPQPCRVTSPSGLQGNLQTPTIQEWNFTVEQQLSRSLALYLGYVGSHGYHNLVAKSANSVGAQICSNPSGCVTGGIGAARGFVPQGAQYIPVGTRPNPYLAGGSFFWFSDSNSSYHALQMELKQRLSHGLQFRANYTWSKNLDTVAAVAGSQSSNGPTTIWDRNDLRRDWGPSSHNLTHQSSISTSYELPFGRGMSGAAGKIAGGWQVNSIITLLSGLPVTPKVGANRSGDGTGSTSPFEERPSPNPAFSGPVKLGNIKRWYDPNAYVLPIVGTYGTVGKGVITGPGVAEVDFSIFKSTAISERINMNFRAEFFNLLNHANFAAPSPVVFSGNAYSPSAGLITRTTTTSRQIQFGLKLIF